MFDRFHGMTLIKTLSYEFEVDILYLQQPIFCILLVYFFILPIFCIILDYKQLIITKEKSYLSKAKMIIALVWQRQ